MKKIYDKSQLTFALIWIGIYVGVMNLALQVCGGFDNLAAKTPGQAAVPVVCIILLAVVATVWVVRHNLAKKFGLCAFKGNPQAFLWFIPLILMSCINLKNGLAMPAPAAVSILMMINLAVAGYVEEIIFRGFLFRAMEQDNLRSAIVVSAVTFGAGHIVNLANTADTLGVLLQVCYAIAIGFAYTLIVYKGNSLWPCIISHMFVNGTSVFASQQGPFTELVTSVRGNTAFDATSLASAVIIIITAGGYALWMWKNTDKY